MPRPTTKAAPKGPFHTAKQYIKKACDPCDDAPDCCPATLSAGESEACLRDTLSSCRALAEDIGVILFGHSPCEMEGGECRPAPHGLAPLLSERVDDCRGLHDKLFEIKHRLA